MWTQEELDEDAAQQALVQGSGRGAGLALHNMLSNRAQDERDYLRMRQWREDRAIPFKPMDSAMADLLPWYAGGMGDE